MRLADHPYLQPLTPFERGLGLVICVGAAGAGLWMASRALLHPELIRGGRWLVVAIGVGGAALLLAVANRLRRRIAPDARLLPTSVLVGVGALLVVGGGWLMAVERDRWAQNGVLSYLGVLALYAAWRRRRVTEPRRSVQDGA